MSDYGFISSDQLGTQRNIRAWVESVRHDPTLHAQRQVIEILLAAIGLNERLAGGLVLKGGTLMAFAFRSERVTADVDFTVSMEYEELEHLIPDELDTLMRRAAAALGYAGLRCRVQSIKKQPRPEGFPDEFTWPALKVAIGYAQQGTPAEKRLDEKKASSVLAVDLSFKEQIYHFQELHLAGPGAKIAAYSIADLIAEKLRATIQQKTRKHERARRQDIYDIDFLLRTQTIPDEARAEILEAFRMKCLTHKITPDRTALADPNLKELSRREWETIGLETSELPDFDESYERVRGFYEALPWSDDE